MDPINLALSICQLNTTMLRIMLYFTFDANFDYVAYITVQESQNVLGIFMKG